MKYIGKRGEKNLEKEKNRMNEDRQSKNFIAFVFNRCVPRLLSRSLYNQNEMHRKPNYGTMTANETEGRKNHQWKCITHEQKIESSS